MWEQGLDNDKLWGANKKFGKLIYFIPYMHTKTEDWIPLFYWLELIVLFVSVSLDRRRDEQVVVVVIGGLGKNLRIERSTTTRSYHGRIAPVIFASFVTIIISLEIVYTTGVCSSMSV